MSIVAECDPQPFVFPVRPFTVEEYHRMGEAGILTEDDAVELLEGLIVPKMVRSPLHDAIVALVEKALNRQLPAGWTTRGQSAFATGASEPEPDVAVVRGDPRDYETRHPSGADAALIVEVADSSLARDRAKARIYASAKVPTYWIVNLVDDCVEVYTQPDASVPQFLAEAAYRRGDLITLTIAGASALQFSVSELLPL